MTKKTYGVKGLIEWNTTITTGKVTLHVPFTGGAITKYGMVPAEYTTDNRAIQHIIENSEYFRSKRIILLKKEDAPKEPEIIKVANRNEAAEYLHEIFGVPLSRITSRDDLIKIALDYNIKFDGI